MSTANDFLLTWPKLIDISANDVGNIEITDTTLTHRVVVDVSLDDVSGCFGYVRDVSSYAAIGFWRDGTVSTLFNKVAARNKTDYDDVSGGLDFTTLGMDSNFVNNTANDFVTPYVLFRLFGDSGVSSGSVPNYANLTTNNPLLKNTAFTAAFTNAIVTSANGKTAGSLDTNTMFQQLLNDTGRFTDAGVPIAALYSPDKWSTDPANVVTNTGPNAWRLQAGDIIQFTVQFTFSHQIRVRGFTTITDPANDPTQSTVKIIPAGETFVIRLQLRVT